jgi:hypothetical protein
MLDRIKAEKDFIIVVVMILVFAVFAYKLAIPLKLWVDLNGFDSQHWIIWAFIIFGCEIGSALWAVSRWESRSRKD